MAELELEEDVRVAVVIFLYLAVGVVKQWTVAEQTLNSANPVMLLDFAQLTPG